MADTDKNEIYLSPAPHIASPVTTRKLMIHVLIALAPLALYGIYLYGVPALIRIIVSVGVAVGAEAAFRKAMGKDIRIKDCSAAVTGLLLALVLPPLIPIWIVVVSAIFAIVVAKEFFGGLGANPFNPALVGRAFAFVSFSRLMTSWVVPHQGFDAVSTATPLSYLKMSEGGVSTAAAINSSSSTYPSRISPRSIMRMILWRFLCFSHSLFIARTVSISDWSDTSA